MSGLSRVAAEFRAAARTFLRRRTAVFFTFLFPVILVLIFGALVGARPTGGGLFTEPARYYVPGYLAVVVLFTPLSRLSSTVARHRKGNRFEKLATTPLRRGEWLAAHTLVNLAVVGAASAIVLVLVALLTGAGLVFAPAVVAFVALGVTLFCGLGAILGRLADSQDGAIAAANTIGLPLLFLSETFVPPALLPVWFRPVVALSPLTYFARGVRQATTTGGWEPTLAVLAVLAAALFVAGTVAMPWRE